jgi:hypothetical protein
MDAACLYQELQSRGLGSDVKVAEVDGTVITGTPVELEIDSFEVVPKNASGCDRVTGIHVSFCQQKSTRFLGVLGRARNRSDQVIASEYTSSPLEQATTHIRSAPSAVSPTIAG